MRLDLPDDALYALHHFAEVELDVRVPEAVFLRTGGVGQHPGGAQQRLARHAARIQTVAAHAVALDQRHFGLDGGRDQRGDEAARSGPDHDQVVVEALRLAELPQHLAGLDCIENLLGDQGREAEQREGDPQGWRQDVSHRLDLAEFRAGIHVYDGAEDHPQLADPVEAPGGDRRQRHREVDREERDRGNQAHGEEVKRAFPLDAPVDGREVLSESPPHRVPEQVTRDGERHRRPERARERHHDHALYEPEYGAGNEGEQGCPGQRCPGHQHVDDEERDGRGPGVRGLVGDDGFPLRSEELERNEPLQVVDEKQRDERRQRNEQDDSAQFHVSRPRWSGSVACLKKTTPGSRGCQASKRIKVRPSRH